MKTLGGFRKPKFEVQADYDCWNVGLACSPNEVDGQKVVTIVRYFIQVVTHKTLKNAVAAADRLNRALEMETHE